MKKLTIDFETRSAAPLKTVGAAAYAQHPTTEVICLALKEEGKAPAIWFSPSFKSQVLLCSRGRDLTILTAQEVRKAVENAEIIEAHNAQFEYFIWKYVMPRYGFPMFDGAKLRCSLAKAAMFGLPRGLDQACQVMQVRQQKDNEGSRLMMSLCKPRAAYKTEKLSDPDWESKLYWRGTPEDFVRLGEYCMQDTRAEEALSNALPDLPESEQRLWYLDLQINDRGVRVDAPAAESVLDVLSNHSGRALKEFNSLTGLNSPTQREKTLRHLISLGVEMEGLTARDVEKALSTTENEQAKRILELRKSLSKSSTAKYKAFIDAKGTDDRLRGMFMYHGAGTGRWTGKIIQPQNFPRGEFPDVDLALRFFAARDLDGLNLFYGDAMTAAATCIRGMIVPAEDCDFVCADYNAIEGRVLAWLAGDPALDVYREGLDPYKVAAASIYHVDYAEVDKAQRQVGKVAELACGYQGGAGAFKQMAINYGVDLPEDEVSAIVSRWREARSDTVCFWRELERACMEAVRRPGTAFRYRNIGFKVRGDFLAMRLPSGRCLWYAHPRVVKKMMTWGEAKDVVAFEGVNSMTRKWDLQFLYGGLLAENATQAVARDILANGMFNAEEAGYPVVLHVHDEIASEVPEGFGSVEEFETLLCRLPRWAEGLPMKAEGWRGKRYRK